MLKRAYTIISIMLVLAIQMPSALASDTEETDLKNEIAALEHEAQTLQTKLTTLQITNEQKRKEIVGLQSDLYNCFQDKPASKILSGE